jgi:endonuclease/exonuclease/phosphatase family metal-dependent hydrolase
MRLATYNVENLFVRARALNLATWAEGKQVLEQYVALSELLEQAVYTNDVKTRMIALMRNLGIDKRNDGRFVLLRENRGQLAKYSAITGTRIVARGRGDWSGWLELRTELVGETATHNTARVVRDVAADVIALIEVEDRRALRQFSERLLPEVRGTPYNETMLIEGNDDRGIDVGLLVRAPHRVGWMRSHADDTDERGRRIFSRDCPEYSIWTASGAVVWVLVNHFKSKGFGSQEASSARRTAQAAAVRAIYDRLRSEGADLIAVVGDLNDTPDSAALAPLLGPGDLQDVSTHPRFVSDGRPGTFQSGHARDKIDYILLSPALLGRVTGGGVWRKGVWGATQRPAWEVYPEMTTSQDAASDHAVLWCDLDV